MLLESGANALLEGYTIEAASSFSSAYERYFEFAINVFCSHLSLNERHISDTFKQVSKQSERQFGAFLFLYLAVFQKPYTLNRKITEIRNRVIHQGHIPTPEEVIEFGELIYQEIYSITQKLQAKLGSDVQNVVSASLSERNRSIPAETPRATTTGAMFYSLASAERKATFREALEGYRKAREAIYGSIPYMRLLRAMLKKSVRVELVETLPQQINNLPRASTGSARTGGLVQRSLSKAVSLYAGVRSRA